MCVGIEQIEGVDPPNFAGMNECILYFFVSYFVDGFMLLTSL